MSSVAVVEPQVASERAAGLETYNDKVVRQFTVMTVVWLVLRGIHHYDRRAPYRQQCGSSVDSDEVIFRLRRYRGCDGALVVRS